jgi:hypothetical protein
MNSTDGMGGGTSSLGLTLGGGGGGMMQGFKKKSTTHDPETRLDYVVSVLAPSPMIE